MLRRGLASIWRPGALGPQSCHNYAQAAAPALSSTWERANLHTSALGLEGKGPDAKNSPEQKKGVRTDPDMAPPKDDRQSTPSSKKTNELEKGAGAPAGKDALKSGEAPKKRGFFTSAWSSAGPADGDSPEQKKGVRTDPDIAPPKMDDDKQQTPSSKKTNELEKGAGAPSGDNHLKPGDKPKPSKGFHTSAGSWADDKKDTDAKDKDDTPDVNRGPSGRPDDPHMQVDQAGDDHPAPKAG
ncbi:hypothetical protein WJX79_010513 [Trebouxia sp. C0005]